MRKRYTTAFKVKVVLELLKEEKTVNQLAAEHGVHPTQVRDWKKQVLDGLPQLFEQTPEATRVAAAQEREREELFAQIGRLTTQLAWLTPRPTGPGTWAKKSGLEPPEK
jgi:transposase-like protein